MKFSTSTNFKEIWLKLFLMIRPSNKSTVMNFKNEALWRYRVTIVQNGGFPEWRQYFTSDRKHPFSKEPSICKALFAMHHAWIIMILSDDQDNWHIKYPIRRKMRHYIIHPINTQFYWLTSSQIDQTWPVNWCLYHFKKLGHPLWYTAHLTIVSQYWPLQVPGFAYC